MYNMEKLMFKQIIESFKKKGYTIDQVIDEIRKEWNALQEEKK